MCIYTYIYIYTYTYICMHTHTHIDINLPRIFHKFTHRFREGWRGCTLSTSQFARL